jgi:short-subunit dehydrogenase
MCIAHQKSRIVTESIMFDAKSYGPWAVIAGASEGVGASFAHQLAAAGINLVLLSRQKPVLEQLARDVTAKSRVQVRTRALDLSSVDVLDRVREITDDVEIGLIVFNAAASTGTGAFLDGPIDAVFRAVRLGPMAHATFAHHFGRQMAVRKRGGIILIGSMAGNAGGATAVFYSAGKAFAQIFAEGLWSELKPLGVNVLYAVLGATRTPVRERLGLKDSPDQYVAEPDDVARECLENIANGPVLVPEHLAEGFRQFSSMPRRQAAETMSSLLLGFQP